MWAIEVELTPKPIARTTRIMTGLLSPMRYAQVVYLTAPAARPGGDPRRGLAAARGAAPGGGPRAARRRVHPGAAAMSVWSWLKLTVCLWLLRKMIKMAGWLLLAALAVAAWPVTMVAAAGYVAAWLRGWPPARLRRAAAWALLPAGIWLAAPDGAAGARLAAGRAGPGAGPGSAAGPTWPPSDLARAFVLLAPFAVPAGLALAALAWAWRIYAITTGLGGIMASAPITFDARQWKRQVRTARGLTEAPGAVPLLARGGRIPVGGTIRAIGHRWHPVFTLPAAACARHMVIVGATGSREDEPDDAAVGGLVHRHPGRGAGREGAPAAAGRAGLQGRPGRPPSRPTAPAACSTARAPAASRSGPMRPGCPCGTCRPQDLAVLLYQMIDTGTGAAAYYADILQAVLMLAVTGAGRAAAEHGRVPGPAGRQLAAGRRGIRPGIPPRRTGSGARPGSCPTSSSATPPCSAGSARRWTAPAPWRRRTPGTASWKAPANPRSPRRRRWR